MGKGATNNMTNRETFTVKNTFIEIDDGFFEGDSLDFVESTAFEAKRQVSEPAVAFGRPGMMQDLGPLGGVNLAAPNGVRGRMGSLQEGAEIPEDGSSSSQNQLFDDYDENENEERANGGWNQRWSEGGHQPGGFMGSDMGDNFNGGQMMGGDCMQFQPMGMQNGQQIFAGAVMMPVKLDNAKQEDPAQTQLPPEWASTFTVMMRNLPNRYTQLMLLEEISSAGFAGAFDFLYLPIDPDTHANKGYAFVNFVDPVQAWRFKGAYEGQQMKCFNSSKFVSVNPAALQGLEANYAHYSTARCSRGNPSARPLFFREPQQKFTPRNAARRGGHRRRVNARSLVDVAVQRNEMMQQRVQPKPPPQPAAAAPMESPVQGGRFCPYCGGATQPSYRFCKFCGSSLEGLEVLLRGNEP